MEACTDLVGNRKKFGKNESPWVSVVNLCNAAIGAGVLSFPFGFRQTGLVGGLLFTGVIWLIEVFSLCLLVRVTEKYNSQSYQQLVLSVLGSKIAVITSLTMMATLIGSMISYMIITGHVFQPVFAFLFGEKSILANRSFVIIIFAFVVILPLAMKIVINSLKYSSLIAVVIFIYLTVATVTVGIKKLFANGFPSDIVVLQAGKQALIILDISVYAFACHIQVVPIFAELAKNPNPFFGHAKGPLEERLLDEEVISQISSGTRSDRVKRMDGIIFVSMSICLICYCLVGIFGYLIFPDVKADILNSFGTANKLMNVARFGMAVVAMACYPLQSHPARSIVDDAFKALIPTPVASISWTRHITITLLLFVFTLIVALLVSSLGAGFVVIGSIGGIMVAFIIPGILLIRGIHNAPVGHRDHTLLEEEMIEIRTRTTSQKCVQVLGGMLMVVLGIMMFAATSFVTITGMISDS